MYIATILKHFISKPKGDARVYMYLILRSLDWFQQVVSIFLCYLTHDKNREFRWYVSNLLDFFFKFSFLILSISISNINRPLHWHYTLFTQIHPLLIARRYHSSEYQLAYTQSSIYIFFDAGFLNIWQISCYRHHYKISTQLAKTISQQVNISILSNRYFPFKHVLA